MPAEVMVLSGWLLICTRSQSDGNDELLKLLHPAGEPVKQVRAHAARHSTSAFPSEPRTAPALLSDPKAHPDSIVARFWLRNDHRPAYKQVVSPRTWKVFAFRLIGWIVNITSTVFLHAAPSPAEALKQMRVAPGFEVRLVASEPGIRQPVTMSFDERGRIWVVQYLQYPNPAGLKATSVDQYLRTKYDRVPEPPPRGPKGADRITICEDTDGDGVSDKFKDFTSGLNLASGMALGHGGVFVVQPPYLLFYPDKNRDDVPDSEPEVLLSGFGMEDAHAFANSLTWGPDGWLYGAHGSTVTAKIRGIEFQQGIWRYHPITREFELFAEGGGNTWGLDFDADGNIIAGTNFGEQIGLHQVQGAFYVKGFAKHGPLHNAHTYGYFDHLPYTGFKGGHVTCGGIVYHGGGFGERFEGAYIAANLLSSAVYWHVLEPNGSSVQGHFGGPLLESTDSTFRPIDCQTGPDGAVYVVDWCDPRATHVDPVDNWDKTSGRIYQVRSLERGTRSSQSFDLAKLTSEQLVNQLTNRNDWFRREARRLLAERRDASILPQLRSQTLQTTSGTLALQSLWALYVTGGFDEPIASRLLQHSDARVRAWTIRLLGDTKRLSPDFQTNVIAVARTEQSAPVRNQLACSAKRWTADIGLRVVRELLRHNEDVSDPQIPLLLWWAIEDKALSHPADVIDLLSSAADWNRPMLRTHILERLARRYASETNRESRQTCSWLLTTALNQELRQVVLRGFDKAWEGQPALANANELSKALAAVWSPNEPLMVRAGLRLGLAEAQQKAAERLTNTSLPDVDRIALAETIGQCQVQSAIPVLAGLLGGKPKLQVAAVTALQNFSDPSIATVLLNAYPKLSNEAKTRTHSVLASRPNWSLQLVHAVEASRIQPKELSTDLLRQMIRHNDPELTASIQKHWGRLQPQSSAEKISTVNQLKLVLNPSGTTLRFKGDPAEGKRLFTQSCATCHKLFGSGNVLGPDLTGAERKNVDWLLSQIVDPSGFIRPEYVNHNVDMKDGRAFSGLIVEQGDNAITIVDAQNQRTVLNRAEIKEIMPSSTSLMPEGLLEAFTPQQVRDLFSYLQSQP